MDTSFVGIAYAIDSDFEKLGYRQSEQEIKKVIKESVSNYADYLFGNVYGYTITNIEGNDLESCFGFVGGHPLKILGIALCKASH
jgi:hypothetical protein